MHLRWFLLGINLVSVIVAQEFSLPNVNAVFQNSPRPFQVNVDPYFIEDTRKRVANTRAPVFIDEPNDGPSQENFTSVRDYWINKYDWKATEALINKKLKQFTTVVRPIIDNTSFPVPLHFVHHRSPRHDAIPLLFIHGWPGSFLEVINIIGNLTNPPNASVPAFHVVAPSIPGFGFSPAPKHPGFGPVKASHVFNELMQQLGYSKYVVQGGDFGGVILRYQASLFPQSVVSVLCNFWMIQPDKRDLRKLQEGLATSDEVIYIKEVENYINEGSGYRLIMQTEPLTLAFGMTDSPLGNAMWMYSLMKKIVDPNITNWTSQDIITWSMMYYIQGPYGGMRLYKEVANDKGWDILDFGTLPLVHVPVAISQFPYDINYRLPLDWAKRGGNVVKRNVHNHGGHFAAWEVPGLLLEDIWSWFGDRKTSGTSVFFTK